MTLPILREIPTSAVVPARHNDLYYSIIENLAPEGSDATRVILSQQVAVVFCKLVDCQDRRYLYGDKIEFAESGYEIQTVADKRDKAKEYELVPVLQKQLISLLDAIGKRGDSSNDNPADKIQNVLEGFQK